MPSSRAHLAIQATNMVVIQGCSNWLTSEQVTGGWPQAHCGLGTRMSHQEQEGPQLTIKPDPDVAACRKTWCPRSRVPWPRGLLALLEPGVVSRVSDVAPGRPVRTRFSLCRVSLASRRGDR